MEMIETDRFHFRTTNSALPGEGRDPDGMAVGQTPKALSLSNPPHRYGIWIPAFAGKSG
jgi:hypothetical protein